ncbi:hypothetical protein MAR_022136 [Mya arenaria]|uniref:Uncharacterized protein n=1 Tax=Mya arenaria TaxID=6604 RepID=A0ABY7DLJ9_MYAAR|nr:hypothetical protein MAR_022136 [Mya arenaria]
MWIYKQELFNVRSSSVELKGTADRRLGGMLDGRVDGRMEDSCLLLQIKHDKLIRFESRFNKTNLPTQLGEIKYSTPKL